MFGRQSISLLKKFSYRKIGTAVVIFSIPVLYKFSSSQLVWCDGNTTQLSTTHSAPSVKIDTKVEENVQIVESSDVDEKKNEKDKDEVDDSQLIISDEECIENDEEWMKEKEKCSFCKMFIHSPCKLQFKRWSLCVDKAKDKELDYTAVCSRYTRALMNCTSENSEFFQALEKKGNDDADDDDAGNDVKRDA